MASKIADMGDSSIVGLSQEQETYYFISLYSGFCLQAHW